MDEDSPQRAKARDPAAWQYGYGAALNDAARELRMRCLKEAAAIGDPAKKIEAARRYFDFVLGTRDAEILDAARQLAEKVR